MVFGINLISLLLGSFWFLLADKKNPPCAVWNTSFYPHRPVIYRFISFRSHSIRQKWGLDLVNHTGSPFPHTPHHYTCKDTLSHLGGKMLCKEVAGRLIMSYQHLPSHHYHLSNHHCFFTTTSTFRSKPKAVTRERREWSRWPWAIRPTHSCLIPMRGQHFSILVPFEPSDYSQITLFSSSLSHSIKTNNNVKVCIETTTKRSSLQWSLPHASSCAITGYLTGTKLTWTNADEWQEDAHIHFIGFCKSCKIIWSAAWLMWIKLGILQFTC